MSEGFWRRREPFIYLAAALPDPTLHLWRFHFHFTLFTHIFVAFYIISVDCSKIGSRPQRYVAVPHQVYVSSESGYSAYGRLPMKPYVPANLTGVVAPARNFVSRSSQRFWLWNRFYVLYITKCLLTWRSLQVTKLHIDHLDRKSIAWTYSLFWTAVDVP
jgi:hypothetical protein